MSDDEYIEDNQPLLYNNQAREVKSYLYLHARSFNAALGAFTWLYTIFMINDGAKKFVLYWISIFDPDYLEIVDSHVKNLQYYYVPYFGALGVLVGGFMAKTIGRRMGMILTDVFVIIGGLLAMWAVW